MINHIERKGEIMIKFVFCISVAPNSWITGTIAMAHSSSVSKKCWASRNISSCTPSPPLDAALRDNRGGPEPFDGIAEVWWESLEVVQRSLADPEAQAAWAALIEDEK